MQLLLNLSLTPSVCSLRASWLCAVLLTSRGKSRRWHRLLDSKAGKQFWFESSESCTALPFSLCIGVNANTYYETGKQELSLTINPAHWKCVAENEKKKTNKRSGKRMLFYSSIYKCTVCHLWISALKRKPLNTEDGNTSTVTKNVKFFYTCDILRSMKHYNDLLSSVVSLFCFLFWLGRTSHSWINLFEPFQSFI